MSKPLCTKLRVCVRLCWGLTGKLDGRPCMLSSWPLLLGWLEGGALDWELKESWDSSW